MNDSINWTTKGKTIKQLIEELQSFENQDLEVKISIDSGNSFKPISLLGKYNGGTKLVHAGLIYFGDE